MDGAEDGAVHLEVASLTSDEGDVEDLAGSQGFDAAVEVVGHLEAVGLDIGVTHHDVHLLALLDRYHRPGVRWHAVVHAVVET